MHQKIYIATKMIVVLCKEEAEFREWLFSHENYQSGAAEKFHGTIQWLNHMHKSHLVVEPVSPDASNGES